MKTIMVTGCAGFIGFHLVEALLDNDVLVIGVDNLNSFYDVNIKYDRIEKLKLKKSNAFIFIEHDIYNPFTSSVFDSVKIDSLVHLAAQAGVRYSLENPKAYLDSNVIGTYNVLEFARRNKINRLLFSSTSSVYGNSIELPNKETDDVDNPIQFYATTKRMCEMMIRNFSVMEKIPSLIFRLFTVYGPWGRPDMALFKFTKSIINNEPIQIYNEGNHSRSFTYIDDIVHFFKSAILLTDQRMKQICGNDFSEVFNLGNPKSHSLSEYIFELEKALKKESKKDFLPLQPGDVLSTLADISKLKGAFGEHDFTDISVGVQNFVTWYQHYYSEKSN